MVYKHTFTIQDFESLGVGNIRLIPNGKVRDLPDGRTANVRDDSSFGSPTLEVLNNTNRRKIKIRYINSNETKT